MHSRIEEIYAGADRNLLASAISPVEGRFVHDLVQQHQCTRTLEVGCANGLSSLFICSGIAGRPSARHTAIDPFQSGHWGNRSVDNVRSAGFNFFELIEEGSEYYLPKLAADSEQIDFAFIDGCHTFDHTLLDFFFINRLLKVGGIVVFDDNDMVGVNRVARYVYNYPCYELIPSPRNRGSQRRVVNTTKRAAGMVMRPLISLAGRHVAEEFLDHSIVDTSGIDRLDVSTLATFRKTAEDTRGQLWYQAF